MNYNNSRKHQLPQTGFGQSLAKAVGSNWKPKYKAEQKYDDRQRSLRELNGLLADGVDHINVHERGATQLGRILSQDVKCEVVIPVYGTFSSMSNLMAWMTTSGHPDKLRDMSIPRLRDFLRSRPKEMEFDHPFARFICGQALIDRIENDVNIAISLRDSGNYPIISYFTREDESLVPLYRERWWTEAICRLRDQLQAERPLNLNYLSPGPISDNKVLIPLNKAASLGRVSLDGECGYKTTEHFVEGMKITMEDVVAAFGDSTNMRSHMREMGVRNVKIDYSVTHEGTDASVIKVVQVAGTNAGKELTDILKLHMEEKLKETVFFGSDTIAEESESTPVKEEPLTQSSEPEQPSTQPVPDYFSDPESQGEVEETSSGPEEENLDQDEVTGTQEPAEESTDSNERSVTFEIPGNVSVDRIEHILSTIPEKLMEKVTGVVLHEAAEEDQTNNLEFTYLDEVGVLDEISSLIELMKESPGTSVQESTSDEAETSEEDLDKVEN